MTHMGFYMIFGIARNCITRYNEMYSPPVEKSLACIDME